MRIIKPSVEIIAVGGGKIDGKAVLKHIELCGRTCYKSEDKITNDSAEKFIMMLIKRGHESVLEHFSFTIKFVCDRGVSHELVRHRLNSFCLSGDSCVIAYKSEHRGSSKRWTLKQLYEWLHDEKRKGRIQLIRLRSVDDNGIIVPGKIKNIIQSGVQPVFELETKSGRVIKATENHRFLTTNGYKKLSELKVGEFVVANGIPSIENEEWIRYHYLTLNKTRKEVAELAGVCETTLYKSFVKFGIKKPLSNRPNPHPGRGKKGMFTKEQRKAMSERMSGENNPSWKGEYVGSSGGHIRAIKAYKAEKCECCDQTKNIERHHIDKNPANNNPENIMTLCQKCHKAQHFGQGVFTVFNDKIVRITPCGSEMTYDMEMELTPHNFVANGLVVHNSQESTRYCSYDGDKFGNEITYVKPCYIEEGSPRWHCFKTSLEENERAYFEDINEFNASPQEARGYLANYLKTEVMMTGNLRQWRTVFKQRTSPAAHPSMREIMNIALEQAKQTFPVVFDDI